MEEKQRGAAPRAIGWLCLAFLIQACGVGKADLSGSLQGHAFRPTKTVFAYIVSEEEMRNSSAVDVSSSEKEGGKTGKQKWLIVFMSSFGFDAKRNFAEAKQARLDQLRQGVADSDILIFCMRLPQQPNGRRFVSATHPDRWGKLSSKVQPEKSESVGEMQHRVQMRVRGNQSSAFAPPTMLSTRLWSYSPTGDGKHRLVTGGLELELVQRGQNRAVVAPDPAKRVVKGSFEAPFIDSETARSNLNLLLLAPEKRSGEAVEQEGERELDTKSVDSKEETRPTPIGEEPESKINKQAKQKKPSDLL